MAFATFEFYKASAPGSIKPVKPFGKKAVRPVGRIRTIEDWVENELDRLRRSLRFGRSLPRLPICSREGA